VVRGRLYTDEYEWEGKRRYEIRLEGHAVGPDLRWCKAELTRVRRGDAAAGSAVDAAAIAEASGASEVWPSADGGRAVSGGGRSRLAGAGEHSDDQPERLGAAAEAGVGA
jgi:single-strand DNA-binding protein